MKRTTFLSWAIMIALATLLVFPSCRKDFKTTPNADPNSLGQLSEKFTWNTMHDVSVEIGLSNASLGNTICRLNIYRADAHLGLIKIYAGSLCHNESVKAAVTVPTANRSLKFELIMPDGTTEIKTLEGNGPFTYTFLGIGMKSGLSGSDADNDGVVDLLDDFPGNPELAFSYSYPQPHSVGDGPLTVPFWATYCFEDLWPSMGDFDMNDLVINYNYVIYTDANHFVKKIDAHFKVKAAGAWSGYRHGFGISLVGLPPDQVESVTGSEISAGTYITLHGKGVEKDQFGSMLNPSVIIPFDNFDNVINNPAPNFFNTLPSLACGTSDQVDMVITLNSSATVTDTDIIPGNFNPFLIRDKNRTYEIHKVDNPPTSWANTGLFGKADDASNPSMDKWYRTNTNLPWALDLPIDFDYPSEYINIIDAYPQFQDWAQSEGTINQSWYLYPSTEAGKVFDCNGSPGGAFTCGDPITDSRDGKTYNTVLIGDQCWMQENLNVGTRIDGSQNQTENGIIEKHCYNDQETNCDVYGGMYEWAEMVQYLNGASNTTSWSPAPTGNVVGICPAGWHIPTDAEWSILTDFLGGVNEAGGKMKEPGTTHWTSPNTGATNLSGFTALAGGYHYNSFSGLPLDANFWTSSETSTSNAWSRYLYSSGPAVGRDHDDKRVSTSIRCIKDSETQVNNIPPSASNVNQSGTAQVGSTLTGSYLYSDPENDLQGTSTYKWYRADDASGTNEAAIAGATSITYTLDAADETKFIRFAVTPVAQTGASPGTEQKSTSFTGPITDPFACGEDLIINHVAGGIAPVDNTVSYGTVTNIPGETSKCWITRNLGASQQATAVDDVTEASAGWYWQFNRKQGFKHDGTTLTPNLMVTNINEDSEWLASNDPCTLELGSGWRLPTMTEWINVDAGGNWTNANGPWNSPLKMHMAGTISGTGELHNVGNFAINWSSTQINNVWTDSYLFMFNNTQCDVYTGSKTEARSIRCLKD